MQSSSQQVVLMGIIGLILAVVLLLFMFIQFFGNEPVPEQVAIETLASSSLMTPGNTNSDTSWQQEFVAVDAGEAVAMSQAEYSILAETAATEESVRSQISDEPTGFHVAPQTQKSFERTMTVTPQPSPVQAEDDSAVSIPTGDQPSIFLTSAQDCGTVIFPETSFGIFTFIGTAGTEPAVICVGEAIGNACTTATFSLGSDSDSQRVYVTSRADHSCSIGVSDSSDSVVLCDVIQMTNFISIDGTPSWQEVERQFAANPGGMMSLLIQGNFLDLQRGETESLNCITYSLK